MSFSKQSIGIYCDSQITDESIKTIQSSFDQYSDIVIFSDKPLLLQDISYAFLPSFYMYFFNHPMVFLSNDKLKTFQSKLVSNELYVYDSNRVNKYEI